MSRAANPLSLPMLAPTSCVSSERSPGLSRTQFSHFERRRLVSRRGSQLYKCLLGPQASRSPVAGAEGREADWGRPRPDSGQPPFHSSRGCFSEMEILSSRILHFSREPGTLGFYVNHQILKSWQRNQMFKTACMQVKKKKNRFVDP